MKMTNLNLRISELQKLELQKQAIQQNRSLSNHVKTILLAFKKNEITHLKKK